MKNLIVIIALTSLVACTIQVDKQAFKNSKNQFYLMDSNHDNCVTLNELVQYRSTDSSFKSGQTNEEIFEEYDVPIEDCFSIREFLQEYTIYLSQNLDGQAWAGMVDYFFLIDTNRDQCIEVNEYKKFFKYEDEEEVLSDEDAEKKAIQAMNKSDLDGNKCFDLWEFLLVSIYY